LQAIGDLDLLESYEGLKHIQQEIEKIEDGYETKQRTLESLLKKENKLEADRKIFEQRKEIEERRSIIENSIKWEKFKVLRKQVKETRDSERAMSEKIANLERTREPVKTFLKGYEEKVARLKENTALAETEYHKEGKFFFVYVQLDF
jgi:chromosome segregation ATPase